MKLTSLRLMFNRARCPLPSHYHPIVGQFKPTLKGASRGISDSLMNHYSQENQIEQCIVDAFAKTKQKEMKEVCSEDLAVVDEFHIGGIVSAKQLLSQLNIKENSLVLDIGCGIGGPSRLCSKTMKCSVIGIDITPEYVHVGNRLNALPKVSMEDLVHLRVDNACELRTIESESIDTAFMLHVGMNLDDKHMLAEQVYRVLKPGGMFGLFDVTIKEGVSDSELKFPLPFAGSIEHCFLSTASQYRNALEETGFKIVQENDKSQFVEDSLRQVLSKLPIDTFPPLSLAVVMGPNFRQKLSNCFDLVSASKLGAVEIIVSK